MAIPIYQKYHWGWCTHPQFSQVNRSSGAPVPPNVFRDHLVPLKELLCVCPTTSWLASMTSCWAGKSTKITWELTYQHIPYQPALLKRIFFSFPRWDMWSFSWRLFGRSMQGDMEFLGCKGQIQGKQQALNLFPYHPCDWYVYLHLVGWFLWQMWVNIPYLHGSYGIIYKMLQSKITTTTANSIKNSNLISGPKKSFHWLCTL